jgi:hypothetical protein
MFLHEVKKNWKKHRTPAAWILLFAAVRIYVEAGLGWQPLNWLGAVKLALLAICVLWLLAFAQTLWAWASAYHKALRTFLCAVFHFSRNYWENEKVVR